MSKYIIEIAEEYEEYFKGVLICGIADGKFAVDVIAREDLEELNSDYINEHFGELQDEAYQRCHDDGYEAGCATAFKPVSDAEYQRGLDEAMSAFNKLYSYGWERDWKAMGFEFDEGEWSTSFEYIIGHYTAAEIVEKVKAYEDNKIHVGDEVTANSGAVYLVTYDKEPEVYGYRGIGRDGITYCYTIGTLTKTGKHYDSVDAYMRGE